MIQALILIGGSILFVVLWYFVGVYHQPKCMFIGGPLNGQRIRMHSEEYIYVHTQPPYQYIYKRTDNNTFTFYM